MKRLNMILILVLSLMLVFILIFHLSGTLKTEVNIVSAPASDHADSFNSVVDILKAGTAIKTFVSDIPESSDGLYLQAVTITLKNSGLCNAEWLEADIAGASGDIAVYSLSGTECDVPSGSSSQITIKFLTRTPDEKRHIRISYYILGKQRSVSVEA